ncbi:glutamic acid-rich protein isoform X1 [Euwallacea similis]|uniref:glutamic acid-rich protein isoform X1 n=1 Tax=Euwallacea similis TaxID=1736056 RepID=UPI00344E6357
MAIELRLRKPHSGSHWGFRLVGGADFNEPLVVVKVNENSFAEDAGLMVGDVIVRVNDTPTAGTSHVAAHELINQAGCEFVMAVRRGLFSDIPVSPEEDGNAEVENILKNSLQQIAQQEDEKKDQEVGPSPTNPDNLATVELPSKPKDVTIQRANKSRKWSTFLVKPKNAKPPAKKLIEERQIIGEPYRVKIIKQPKRDPNEVLNHRKKSVQFETVVTEVEISRDTSIADSIDSLEIEKSDSMDPEVELEASVKEISEETTHVEIQEFDEEEMNQEEVIVNETNEDQCTIKKLKPILKPAPLDIHLDPIVCEASLSLEDQLAAVQKQLLTLSQLPTAIQVTLEAVTQQLNKIVLEKAIIKENSRAEVADVSEATIEDNAEDNLSLSENAEGDLTQDENEEHLEELEEDQVVNGNEEVLEEEEDEEVQEEEAVEEVPVDPYAGLTEEEKNAKIKEELLLAKKKKIEEERRKMDWTQRPIVLPGGRKWSDPDDATPKFRKPKMSDEKICKTIEDHSEVIVGKTKGINFLKFEPPAKNLDYLQKSEVYRLIHDMEPPVRGVGARAEKILSEKDYYGDKGAP